MYGFLRSQPLSRSLKEQLPVLAAAILIAEFFYKFHSFVLECLAFLLTWFVLDALRESVSVAYFKATSPPADLESSKTER